MCGVKLDPLTMRLLLYLADNAGRVIALQELLDAVWPNVVVTPQSVYNTVAQLRRTLGDLADAPTYIANIPRKGYRLIAKVEHRQVERRAAPAAMPPATVIPPSAARAPNAAPPPTSPGLVNVDPPPSRVGPSRVFLIGSLALALIGLLALVLARQGVLGRRSASTEAVVDHSVAVLPFRDLSAAQDRAYLAEGLAEQIGTVLSGVPKLRVVGRASAFASRSASIPDIAKKLHVDHVLEGSVQSSPHGVRINAALIRTDTGQYLWSKTYYRATDEYFSVEDEIARDIAGALSNTGLPPNRAASTCGKSGAANNLLLQGRYLGRRNTTAGRERSIELYQQALALEPDCAQAWAWLSTAYGVQAANGWVAPELGYQRARDAAEHALRLNPLEADAHAALAYVEEFHDWNWSGADAELKRALELDAGDVRVLNMNGHFALDLGQSDRSIDFYRRAVDKDPLSTGALGGLAAALWSRGQLVEAEAAYRQAASMSPVRYHTWIALVLLERGEKAAALAEIGKETDPETRLMGLGIIQSALGNREASDSAVAELIAKYADRPFHIAAVYAHRGETDAAFHWLENAFTRRSDEMLWLKVGLLVRPLRADPRYAALLRRMGLPLNAPDAVSSARALTAIAPAANR